MFTDWTMQDHRYFYARGVIYGVVLATMFWKVFVPWLCKCFRKPNPSHQGTTHLVRRTLDGVVGRLNDLTKNGQ